MPELEPRARPEPARARATVACILEASALLLQRGALDAFDTHALPPETNLRAGTVYR